MLTLTLGAVKRRDNEGRRAFEWLANECKPSSEPVNPRTMSTAAFVICNTEKRQHNTYKRHHGEKEMKSNGRGVKFYLWRWAREEAHEFFKLRRHCSLYDTWLTSVLALSLLCSLTSLFRRSPRPFFFSQHLCWTYTTPHTYVWKKCITYKKG